MSVSSDRKKRAIRPERVLTIGFFLLICIGTVLLAMPFASVSGKSIGLGKSAFTATSAVCVTGLVAVDTGTAFTMAGQVILLILIQVGGLGFMIFATLIMMILGRKITLSQRMVIRDSMNSNSLSGLLNLTKAFSFIALLTELTGALLLAIRFVPRYGIGKGIFYSLFHAVSAFCNAGFDLFGNFSSLTGFSNDPLVLFTVCFEIIVGGLGFSVIFELIQKHFKWQELSLHARLVLVITGALLVAGMLFMCINEWANPRTFDGMEMGVGAKLMNGFFQSVTMRTAGFNSIDLSGMTDASKVLSIFLMMIGASPASTGGGLKTTTMGLLFLALLSVIRGEQDVNCMKHRIPQDLVRRALAIFLIFLVILLSCTLVITALEHERYDFLDIFFECTSALATVGVSTIGTPNLSAGSRIIIMFMMFMGRVGPLSLAMAFANKRNNSKGKIRYPEENITIG